MGLLPDKLPLVELALQDFCLRFSMAGEIEAVPEK